MPYGVKVTFLSMWSLANSIVSMVVWRSCQGVYNQERSNCFVGQKKTGLQGCMPLPNPLPIFLPKVLPCLWPLLHSNEMAVKTDF